MDPLGPGYFQGLGSKFVTTKLNMFLSSGANIAPGLFWDLILPISLPIHNALTNHDGRANAWLLEVVFGLFVFLTSTKAGSFIFKNILLITLL